ncbi:MAG: VOC family protein [Chloroflexi bacterium]|nr:MAG: VOC family protein [Chloroflexota bacterium]
MNTLLPSQTHLGTVALTVADLERSLAYYQTRIGLQLLAQNGQTAKLGAGDKPLLLLQEQPGARPTRGTTGLYHFAILLPSRLALAKTLYHLISTKTPIGGFSDHAVSEAIYLTDPDGHGIELYRDRPREEWQWENGRLQIVTKPLDLDSLLGELNNQPYTNHQMPTGTTIGHIHLHVAHLQEATQFYTSTLGFDFIANYGNSAAFVSAGGYHHHIGLNTWAGVGAPPPPPDTAHLLWYEIKLPDSTSLQNLVEHIRQQGHAVEDQNGRFYLQDPSQNGIILTTD